MFSGTAVAVAAGPDFVVKRTVDFVLLGAEDGGEVVGHCRRTGRRVMKKRVESVEIQKKKKVGGEMFVEIRSWLVTD